MVNFKTDNNHTLTVFTTRVDTIFGVTFIVIAPENKIVGELTTAENKIAVEKYIELTNSETEIERKENKNKTGVFTGSYAINPVNNKKIPIYISDYVINSYATGMVMGVPAHDQRDYEFAKKFNIDIIPVIDGDISNQAFEEDGIHINSSFMNGLKKQEAIQKGLQHIIKDNIGTKFTTTKLHD
jgi:leucyl-tRNA synthetase